MLWLGCILIDEFNALGQAVISNSTTINATSSIENTGYKIYQSLPAFKIGSILLLATLSFWFIRIVVRIFLSHIHLENDAAERVTMAKTYLALNKDAAFASQANLGTVIAALFTPTGDGIVKDEGLPPSAMEWLTKLSGNK